MCGDLLCLGGGGGADEIGTLAVEGESPIILFDDGHVEEFGMLSISAGVTCAKLTSSTMYTGT
jgi:hypothetical protein